MGMMDDMMATMGVNYVKAIAPSKATGKLAEIYKQIQADFMIATPFTLHSSQPTLLAGTFALERESMFYGIVPRARKEAIAAGVSTTNECPYCIDAHTMMMSAVDAGDAADAIHKGGNEIQDTAIEQLFAWAKSTDTPNAPIIQNPPFKRQEAPEIFGTALAFHYINRMVNIFLDEALMPGMNNLGPVSGFMRKMTAGIMMKPMINRKTTAGESLRFLPKADLPDEFSWASENQILADTFTGMNEAVNQAIQGIVSQDVLDRVQNSFDVWKGEQMGISRAWLNEVVANLTEKEQIAARLMLLAGLASYQISESDIQVFRMHYPSDADLIAVTAWGAYAAIRRISSWLPVPEIEDFAEPV
jgi:AhpD family alkylhydroperoxidase